MKKSIGTASSQEIPLGGVDSAFSSTAKPPFMARTGTRDRYRCRFMPAFAARDSGCLSSFDARRTLTGLAGSPAEGMAHGEEDKNAPESLSFNTFAIANVVAT
jgi:hypothetical protein